MCLVFSIEKAKSPLIYSIDGNDIIHYTFKGDTFNLDPKMVNLSNDTNRKILSHLYDKGFDNIRDLLQYGQYEIPGDF